MKNLVIPKIVVLFLIIVLSSCSARKYMNAAGVSYEIGEYFHAIEKYRKAYRSQNLKTEKAKWHSGLANVTIS